MLFVASIAISAALVLPMGAKAWHAKSEASDTSPDKTTETYDRACSFFALGRYKAARKEFCNVANATTDRKLGLRCRMKAADCLFYDDTKPKTKRYLDAKAAYEKILGEYPGEKDLVWAQIQVGNSLAKLGMHEEAVAAYRALIARYPGQPYVSTARYRIGLCLLEQGQYQEARAEFKMLLKQHPDSPEAPCAAFDIARAFALEAERKPVHDEEQSRESQ